MTIHNFIRNRSFYQRAGVMDILASIEPGTQSEFINDSIEMCWRYPYNPVEMLDRFDSLNEKEEAYFNLFIEAAKEAQRHKMMKIMNAPKPPDDNNNHD